MCVPDVGIVRAPSTHIYIHSPALEFSHPRTLIGDRFAASDISFERPCKQDLAYITRHRAYRFSSFSSAVRRQGRPALHVSPQKPVLYVVQVWNSVLSQPLDIHLSLPESCHHPRHGRHLAACCLSQLILFAFRKWLVCTSATYPAAIPELARPVPANESEYLP